jgi:hypothetical protein
MLWRKVPARCREDCEGLLLTRFMVNALTEFEPIHAIHLVNCLRGMLSPFDRHDGSASNTTFTTSDSVLQIEHSVARFQPKPSQECRSQQRRVSAGDAIDLDEIPRPEILDAGRVMKSIVISTFSFSAACMSGRRKSGSYRTHRWREPNSNPRSPYRRRGN